MFSFTPRTKIKSSEVNQNFTDLSTGAGDVADNRIQLFRGDTLYNFVQSGLIWTQTTGLVGSMTLGVAYVTDASGYMQRLALNSIASKTFTASKDIYIDVTSAGVVTYTEVANGATTGFALAATAVRIAKIVTGASAITSINQSLADVLGTAVYPNTPHLVVAGLFGQGADYVGVGGWRLAGMDTVYYNTGGLKLTGAGGVQVTYKGLYRITATYTTQDGDANQLMITAGSKSSSAGNIGAAGTDFLAGRYANASQNPRGYSGAGVIGLNANDVLYNHLYSSSTVNYRMKGSSNGLDFTCFEVELVRRLP